DDPGCDANLEGDQGRDRPPGAHLEGDPLDGAAPPADWAVARSGLRGAGVSVGSGKPPRKFRGMRWPRSPVTERIGWTWRRPESGSSRRCRTTTIRVFCAPGTGSLLATMR